MGTCSYLPRFALWNLYEMDAHDWKIPAACLVQVPIVDQQMVRTTEKHLVEVLEPQPDCSSGALHLGVGATCPILCLTMVQPLGLTPNQAAQPRVSHNHGCTHANNHLGSQMILGREDVQACGFEYDHDHDHPPVPSPVHDHAHDPVLVQLHAPAPSCAHACARPQAQQGEWVWTSPAAGIWLLQPVLRALSSPIGQWILRHFAKTEEWGKQEGFPSD